MVADASADWRKDVAREVSVQVRSTPGRDLEADVADAAEMARSTPGKECDVRVYTKAEFSEALLAPWLGEGLDLSELPTRRMDRRHARRRQTPQSRRAEGRTRRQGAGRDARPPPPVARM